MEFRHVSVMPEETANSLLTREDGIYVDCTLGGAGHSLRIASRLSPSGRLLGIDRDDEAIEASKKRISAAIESGVVRCSVDVAKGNFSDLDDILRNNGIGDIDGILFDLGVSSRQLDTASRGFSYMRDANLDMRMDRSSEISAYDVVNGYSEQELARIFFEYGEERWSKRIAEFIVKERKLHDIVTTFQLVDIINMAIPLEVRKENWSNGAGHPAKRIFQAIRIEVNGELSCLEKAFRSGVKHLREGGRIAIITFHSLEDRIAKRTLKELARGCVCPPKFPVCVCGHSPEVRMIGKPMVASPREIECNTRAKSAKLRVAEKLSMSKNGKERK